MGIYLHEFTAREIRVGVGVERQEPGDVRGKGCKRKRKERHVGEEKKESGNNKMTGSGNIKVREGGGGGGGGEGGTRKVFKRSANKSFTLFRKPMK